MLSFHKRTAALLLRHPVERSDAVFVLASQFQLENKKGRIAAT